MDNNISVYLVALRDSLQSKWDVLKEILSLTEQQEKILNAEEMNWDSFDGILQKKGKLLEKIEELDRGFEDIFDKVGATLKDNATQYKPQILELQNSVRVVTECGVKVQVLEKKNKDKFVAAVANKRKEIKDFRTSNKTAASYYQNMANQHHEWQSYFYDKKK